MSRVTFALPFAFSLSLIAGCVTAPEPGTTADELTPCGFSELGQAVLAAAQSSNPDRSTVPIPLLASTENAAEPALLDGPQIFPRLAELVAAAREEVDLVTYVFDTSKSST